MSHTISTVEDAAQLDAPQPVAAGRTAAAAAGGGGQLRPVAAGGRNSTAGRAARLCALRRALSQYGVAERRGCGAERRARGRAAHRRD